MIEKVFTLEGGGSSRETGTTTVRDLLGLNKIYFLELKNEYSIMRDNILNEVELDVIPETINHSHTAVYKTQNVLGRITPIQMYSSGSEDTYSFSVTYHSDLINEDRDEEKKIALTKLVDTLQSFMVPDLDQATNALKSKTVYFQVGSLSGIGSVDVSINWKAPISVDGYYKLVELTFTITVDKSFQPYVSSKPISDLRYTVGLNTPSETYKDGEIYFTGKYILGDIDDIRTYEKDYQTYYEDIYNAEITNKEDYIINFKDTYILNPYDRAYTSFFERNYQSRFDRLKYKLENIKGSFTANTSTHALTTLGTTLRKEIDKVYEETIKQGTIVAIRSKKTVLPEEIEKQITSYNTYQVKNNQLYKDFKKAVEDYYEKYGGDLTKEEKQKAIDKILDEVEVTIRDLYMLGEEVLVYAANS